MDELRNQAMSWIRFVRKYGPAAHNENMYDEFIHRSARRARVDPLRFDHPFERQVLAAFDATQMPTSVILTGTAGDGKTFLCRHVWEQLGGDAGAWASETPYLSFALVSPQLGELRLHIIRDLSAWAPQHGRDWDPDTQLLLQLFSESIFREDSRDLFLIAANDGQLVESWRRLDATPAVARALDVFEQLLVNDEQQADGVRLQFYNLSRGSSAELFDEAVQAFLNHPGWRACYSLQAGSGEFFGPDCPIRRNFELLSEHLFRQRVRSLLALCDYNRLHVPIRQILILFANAVLGHPDARDRLMDARDVSRIIRDGTAAQASIYGNLFGANLPESRRGTGSIFDYLDRFRIGQETSNRVDNILIFGEADDTLRPDFHRLLGNDSLYGAGIAYRAAQKNYIDGGAEDSEAAGDFLEEVMHQRRRLFFTIPEEQEDEFHLWELTVFRHAGEYLDRVVGALERGERISRPIVARLVRGLNRVFTGMLVATDREVLLATSPVFSHARVSRLLDERVSVDPRLGERVDVILEHHVPSLVVWLNPTFRCTLPLLLTRFEFLSRVAEGALPSSFSRECYEDMLAFKTQLLAKLYERRSATGESRPPLSFRLLDVDDNGNSSVVDLEVKGV